MHIITFSELHIKHKATGLVCRPVEKEAAYFTKPGVDKRTGEDGSTSQGLESACTVSTLVCLTVILLHTCTVLFVFLLVCVV